MKENVEKRTETTGAISQGLAGQLLSKAKIESLLQQSAQIVHSHTTSKQLRGAANDNSCGSNYFSDHLDYMMVLNTLNIEFRYGKGAQQKASMEYVTHLFNRYMDNVTYRFKLEQLKAHDRETFLHAVDVFTLCTIFAKQQNMPILNSVAIGFLFHDIGKLSVPKSMLEKRPTVQLTEHDKLECHIFDGQQLFREIGLRDLAYLAKPHSHIREGQRMPLEVELLHIVKVYSALTIEAMHPAEAMAYMYANKQLYNEQLLHDFTHFLSIFPKSAVVLLSDGSEAVVDSIGVANPLLPKVRSLQGNKSFHMPYDFSVHICKMIASHELSLERVFANLSQAILNAQYTLAKKYLEHLIRLYQSNKWYTHIHIPLFNIMKILQANGLLPEDKSEKMKEMYRHMMKETKVKLTKHETQHEIVLVLVDDDVKHDELISLFEGILYSEAMYPIVIRNEKSVREIEEIVERLNIHQLFVLSNEHMRIRSHRATNVCHFVMSELEKVLLTLSYKDLQAGYVRSYLQQYQAGTYAL